MVSDLRFWFLAYPDEEMPGMWNGRIPEIGGSSEGYCTYSDSLENLLKRAVELADLWIIYCWELNQEPTQGPVEGLDCLYQVSPSLKVQVAWMMRQLRIQRGLTQAEAATAAGMTQTAYARLENPKKSNATVATLDRIGKALGQLIRVEALAV